MTKKEINEKTFELNITSELIDLSKSFIWYLNHEQYCNLSSTQNFRAFISNSVIYAGGLTQEEESRFGYDVSINQISANKHEQRLMFLQYKSGIRKRYSTNPRSLFKKSKAKEEGRTAEHVMFTFNDAAVGKQHSMLKSLSNQVNINPLSVMYVFPRITEIDDFRNNIGNLLSQTSFIPVNELDRQAANQAPQIIINDGEVHKYRTSYDGSLSELNLLFLLFLYDQNTLMKILSELICIQIQRLINFLNKDKENNELFLRDLQECITQFFNTEFTFLTTWNVYKRQIEKYIEDCLIAVLEGNKIPSAPNKYTTIIPKNGLQFNINKEFDYSSLTYQLF